MNNFELSRGCDTIRRNTQSTATCEHCRVVERAFGYSQDSERGHQHSVETWWHRRAIIHFKVCFRISAKSANTHFSGETLTLLNRFWHGLTGSESRGIMWRSPRQLTAGCRFKLLGQWFYVEASRTTSFRSIPKSHVVARVPRHAMITLDLAKKSAMLKKAFERDPIVSGMDNVGLALFLACQWLNKEKSKWQSYISVLPTTFPTPLFYSEEQLLQLKPSPIFEEALMFYRTISRQFCYFLLAVAKNKLYESAQRRKEKNMEPPIFYNSPFTVANFTPTLYFWAVGIVTTRVNMVPSETLVGEDGKPTIVSSMRQNVLKDLLFRFRLWSHSLTWQITKTSLPRIQ